MSVRSTIAKYRKYVTNTGASVQKIIMLRKKLEVTNTLPPEKLDHFHMFHMWSILAF